MFLSSKGHIKSWALSKVVERSFSLSIGNLDDVGSCSTLGVHSAAHVAVPALPCC